MCGISRNLSDGQSLNIYFSVLDRRLDFQSVPITIVTPRPLTLTLTLTLTLDH